MRISQQKDFKRRSCSFDFPKDKTPHHHYASRAWASHILRYMPPWAISSWCVPISVILPPWNTQMTSASLIVLRRWATAMVMRSPSLAASARAPWTIFSLSVSRALVASSRSKTFGLRMSARAMAIRCL